MILKAVNDADGWVDTFYFHKLAINGSGVNQEISVNRLSDGLIDSQNVSLAVYDFWKKHPISAQAVNNTLSWTAIKTPTQLAGGTGLTIDFALSLDSANYSANTLATQLSTPPPTPATKLPAWWHDIDGTLAANTEYDNFVEKTALFMRRDDEAKNNYGWKNWGDFQIDFGYTTAAKYQNWGALQQDLGLGLMMAYLRTDDAAAWNRTKAAVRNIMDTQIAKFSPYSHKRSGAGRRKGECLDGEANTCQESIPEFDYHSRPLLVYYHHTGEEWARDVAHMIVDHATYFALTRGDWMSGVDRAAAWGLHNLYYGLKAFPEGTAYLDTQEGLYPKMVKGSGYAEMYSDFVLKVVEQIEKNGGFPGEQPVWQGHILSGLILAYDSGVITSVTPARLRAAMITSVASSPTF